MIVSMLTTIDNPYSPFDEWPEWFAFDTAHGYNTPGFLARVAVVSYEMSEADQNDAIEQAIDEICRENVRGIYKKVTQEVPDPV